MTCDEAEKLARVFATADEGCPCCVRSICAEATKADLGFEWVLDEGTVTVTQLATEPEK